MIRYQINFGSNTIKSNIRFIKPRLDGGLSFVSLTVIVTIFLLYICIPYTLISDNRDLSVLVMVPLDSDDSVIFGEDSPLWLFGLSADSDPS